MSKLQTVIIPLRVLLVLLFAGFIVAQLLSLPGQFRHMAEEAPELGAVPWVLLTVAVLELVCFQIVIVCTWRLLTMVTADRIFSPQAFLWVDVIVWAIAVGWVLLAGIFVYVGSVIYFTPELRDPGIPIFLFGMTLTGAVVLLTVVVLRALLRQATTLRTELEDVI